MLEVENENDGAALVCNNSNDEITLELSPDAATAIVEGENAGVEMVFNSDNEGPELETCTEVGLVIGVDDEILGV